jgi:hypothetical protein
MLLELRSRSCIIIAKESKTGRNTTPAPTGSDSTAYNDSSSDHAMKLVYSISVTCAQNGNSLILVYFNNFVARYTVGEVRAEAGAS